MLGYLNSTVYNIYIIYISDKSLSHFKMKQIIIKKFYEVIRIINKKSDYLRGLQGGTLGRPLSRAGIQIGRKNMKQTQRRGRNI